jgi:hypothetical protein
MLAVGQCGRRPAPIARAVSAASAPSTRVGEMLAAKAIALA